MLGLLALLLGFTFSMAVDRFDARRAVVLEEANAIGTAYLRTQVLDEFAPFTCMEQASGPLPGQPHRPGRGQAPARPGPNWLSTTRS